MRLFRQMGRRIVVSHDPSDIEESKKKRPALVAPTRAVSEMREHERYASFVRSTNQKSNTDTDGGQDIDRRKPQNDLMQLLGRQSANNSEDDQHGQ